LRFCLLLVNLISPLLLFAQQYTYVQYNVKDGLAGSTVYDLCQDKEGFMWFATDAGISRFDGTHFKNFTLDDGLPSNEILRVFADSKGRIWMAPFKKTICYYHEGKIFTPENDSLLSQIKLDDFVSWVAEDKDSNLVIQAGDNISWLKKTNETNYEFKKLMVKHAISVSKAYPGEGFLITTWDTIYKMIDGKLYFWHTNDNEYDVKYLILKLPDSTVLTLDRKPGIINVDVKDSKVLFVNTDNGAWEMDTVKQKYKYLHLPGKTITHALIDNENNTWFATLGHGVYKLVSKEFLNFSLEGSKEPGVYCLEKWDNSIAAGSAFSHLFTIKDLKVRPIDLSAFLTTAWISIHERRNRVYSLTTTSDGELIVGMDGLIIRLSSHRQPAIKWQPAVKSICQVDSNTILVGGKHGVSTMRIDNLQPIDAIWDSRATSISYASNEYYVGTTDDLFVVQKNKSVQSIGSQIPALHSHISQIISAADSIMWVATYGKGVIGMKNKRLFVNLNAENGLSSNICRSLFLQKNFLWVGTDKGLNKVDITSPEYKITSYTTADGLSSNVINAIYADGNNIYIGSPAGITLFDERKISRNSQSKLHILGVRISNKSMPVDSVYTVSFKESNVKIDYTCISFRSEGDILYKYRLKGLNNSWDSTRSTSLEYPSLPAGSFEFELVAINKFGLESNPVVIRFVIYPPFWKTLWFRVLVIAAIVSLAWLFVLLQFNRFRKKEREKTRIRQQLNELEQKALRAQMNPHFIFNCLSSIQGFIMTKDFETTNNYLTEFARLIRQTLDNSEKTAISIENEIRYLSSYLEIEKMRYANSFDYSIEVGPEIKQDFTYIPNMLLQPYVENCIRHGLRHKDSHGLVQLKFMQTEKELVSIVQDNGIGRQKAGEFKSQIRIEYQSRGMKLTEERINLLNKHQEEKIRIEVIDLLHDNGKPAGTKIIIHFPTAILKKLM
jgi:ligand-binding sensor domain-containing protein